MPTATNGAPATSAVSAAAANTTPMPWANRFGAADVSRGSPNSGARKCTDRRPNGDNFGPEMTRSTKPMKSTAANATATPPAPAIPDPAAAPSASTAPAGGR